MQQNPNILAFPKEYGVWKGMRKRCLFKSEPKDYKNYGGRGITICDRWASFDNFIADMGPRPPGLTLERINNDGNYEPGNCRWATRKEQNSNTRTNLRVNYGGKIVVACRTPGISSRRISDRLLKGWSEERAVNEPVLKTRSKHFVEYDGLRLSVGQWDKKLGFSRGCMHYRIVKLGWSVEKAINAPQRTSRYVKRPVRRAPRKSRPVAPPV